MTYLYRPPTDPLDLMKRTATALAEWFKWRITVKVESRDGVDNFVIDRLAGAQPAAQPLSDAISLMRQAVWSEAPLRSEWGAGMMVADVALTKDETMTLYAHRDALDAAKEPK